MDKTTGRWLTIVGFVIVGIVGIVLLLWLKEQFKTPTTPGLAAMIGDLRSAKDECEDEARQRRRELPGQGKRGRKSLSEGEELYGKVRARP